ncbi:MAG: PAS domain S-box protein [Aquabacterium sp.]|uniref:PAS domain S-box protein n=1 Tax=Aquabacterium sp. TaxID=1872578 RepID=UPI0025C2961D|nr:PAS domain S-box protein [Aquabacterium sp.]MBI5927622.1 PAS domain S-box protein [Aquabacterium sp.]
MTQNHVPHDENERIALLHASKLLNADVSPAFEAIQRLVACALNCPISAINLVDTHTVWSLARQGLDVRQTSLDDAFCHTVVKRKTGLQVSDASQDERFKGISMVAGPSQVKAYIGMPLLVEGHALGTLCAMDRHPREWTEEQALALQDLAITAAALIQQQVDTQRLRKMEARVRTASLAGSDWLWETDKDGILQWVSAGLKQHTGLDPATEIGLKGVGLYIPRDDETRESWDRFVLARARREPFSNAIGVRMTPRGPITVSISGTPVFSSRGEFMGYRGASRNVTRQIEAEHEARRADQLLRQAIESFHISVMITDRQGRVVLANQHWRDHAGQAHDDANPYWSETLRKLVRAGIYPDAAGHEDEYINWRLNLHTETEPREVQFQNQWILVKDHQLPDGSVVHFAMDITQNKKDAEKLREKQKALTETKARLRAVLRALPDLWFVIDHKGRYIDGHADHPLLLKPLAELKKTPLGSHLPAETAELQRQALQRLQSSGQPQRFEYDLAKLDGISRHFEARMTPMPDGQTLFLTRDITERQLAAEKLRVSEELYRSVAATISDGLVIVELGGRVVALNQAASRILAVSPEELTHVAVPGLPGLTLLEDDLVTPVPFERWPINMVLATGQRVDNHVHALRRADGEILWVQISCHLLRVDTQAPPFAAMATLRDITRERHAQQELQLSEERWKFALEGAGDGVWDWNLQAGRVYYSQRWKTMLGYDDDEITSTADEFISRIHPSDRELVADSLHRYFKVGDGIHQTEFRLQHKSGHYLSILSRGKVVSRHRDGHALRVVGTHSDITPVKQAERALREKQTAEAASAAKSEFLSRMSHEIRTPLNAVNGFAQLLQLQLTQQKADAGQQNYVEQILQASRHLMGLVNDVLDLQQVETGILSFKPENLPLAEEVGQCLSMLSPMADRRNITMLNMLQEPWVIMADRQRLRQVIMNIGSNAIKYNQTGGSVRIYAECLPENELVLTIEDSGPGMSPQQLSRLFQPFERLGRETTNIEGTGLGLIITRSLLEAMGGRMDIRSQPGSGTRVNIILPLAGRAPHHLDPAPDSAYPPLSEPGSSLESNMSPTELNSDGAAALPALHVLYVEDNRINAMLFEEALRPFPQIELVVAEDGQMALSMAKERAPDVLVLDAHLPGMSGFEVLKALRTLPALADAPAFMCSADAMPEDVARAQAAGFTGYWTKPIDIVAVTTELCRLAARGDNAAP